MRTVVAILFSVFAASGVALASAPAASAGCAPGWTPWGGGERCDGPIQPDGFFERCDVFGAFGFVGPRQCYMVDSNNLGGNLPRVGP